VVTARCRRLDSLEAQGWICNCAAGDRAVDGYNHRARSLGFQQKRRQEVASWLRGRQYQSRSASELSEQRVRDIAVDLDAVTYSGTGECLSHLTGLRPLTYEMQNVSFRENRCDIRRHIDRHPGSLST
jgi:hypothetical protein